jgi:hypothetical protein
LAPSRLPSSPRVPTTHSRGCFAATSRDKLPQGGEPTREGISRPGDACGHARKGGRGPTGRQILCA